MPHPVTKRPPPKQASTPRRGTGTLYHRVHAEILADIRARELRPGDRLGSTQALAARLRVSPSTIRQSLQMLATMGVVIRKPRVGTIVAPGAGAAGTAPTAAGIVTGPGLALPAGAAATRPHTPRLIVLLLPDIIHPEFARLARAFQDVARQIDMDVVIGSTDNETQRYEEIIRRQLDNDILGIVIVPPLTGSLSPDLLQEMQRRNVPGVAVFRDVPAMGWPLVYSDYFHSKFVLARHLCEVGCKRIAFFIQEDATDAFRIKHYAFLRALMAAGRTTSEDLLLQLPRCGLEPSRESAEESEHRMEAWLRAHPDVDGICCAHDEDAFRAVKVLKKLHRRVPEDVAVGGDGGFGPYLGYGADALTTVDLPCVEMAEQACRVLTETAQGKPPHFGIRLAVPGKLIVGRSTRR